MKTRYDDYSFYKSTSGSIKNLPCMIFQNIVRTLEHQSDRANWHEELELQYIICGEGYALIDGEKYNITSGDIVIANSNSVHYTGTDTKIEYTALIINSDFCKNSEIDYSNLIFKTIIKEDYLIKLFNNVVKIYNDDNQNYVKAKLQASLLHLLIEICENHLSTKINDFKHTDSYKQVKTTICYIRKNYNNKITLELLSSNIYTNKYSLSRKFKAITGQTIVEYINNYRCERAKDFLRNGLSVNETAHICGFNNISFFIKTFKNFTGHLPTYYKN